MRPELQQAIDRLKADPFIGQDVLLLIDEIERTKPRTKDAPKPPRPRDLILDEFARIEGMDLKEVGPKNWSRFAKCKKELLIIAPAVTPEEMRRRAALYRKEWPTATISADALVKWWPKFSRQSTSQTEIKLGENLS